MSDGIGFLDEQLMSDIPRSHGRRRVPSSHVQCFGCRVKLSFPIRPSFVNLLPSDKWMRLALRAKDFHRTETVSGGELCS